MKILIIVMSLCVSACGTVSPYRCTSGNSEICDLQRHMVRLEDMHNLDRKQSPVILTDQELIDELNRRRRVKTYALPEK